MAKTLFVMGADLENQVSEEVDLLVGVEKLKLRNAAVVEFVMHGEKCIVIEGLACIFRISKAEYLAALK
jgi:hypothetical protein